MSTWITRAAGAVLLALLLCGCGEGSPAGSSGASGSAQLQPRSTTGVTVDVRNWADHAGDPAVLAYKRSLEATYGSTQQGKVLPGVREDNTPALAKLVLRQLAVARKDGWRVRTLIPVHVESARTRDRSSTLTMCTWSPASSITGPDGTPLQKGAGRRQWDREVAHVVETGGRWRVSGIDYPHTTCAGLAAP